MLDLNLPRMDGVAILRFLRTGKTQHAKPSTDRAESLEDRVTPGAVIDPETFAQDMQCLDLGADDDLGKPFSFTELSARIRALMRCSHMPAESALAVDDLKLDPGGTTGRTCQAKN